MSGKNHKLIFFCVIGNILEWYDFAIYSAFAPVLAQHFFPSQNKNIALLNTFIVFAMGYILRPIGGLWFGHLGDRYSRSRILVISLLMMGCATTAIGFLPTYQMIGTSATLLFVFLRVIQGLAVGGEYPGSMVTIVEAACAADSRYPSFMGSLPFFGAICGFLIAITMGNLIITFMSNAAFTSYGWRIPFMFSIFLALVGIHIRLRYQPDIKKAVGKAMHFPVLELLKNYYPKLVTAVCVLVGSAVFECFFVVFLPTYLSQFYHLSNYLTFRFCFINNIILGTFMPLGAYLTDRFHHYRSWLIRGYFVLLITVIPLFMLMTINTTMLLVGVSVLTIVFALAVGPLIASVVLSFPTSIRCTGVALAYGVAYPLTMGTGAILFISLIQMFGVTAPAYYIFLLLLVGVSSVPFLKRIA